MRDGHLVQSLLIALLLSLCPSAVQAQALQIDVRDSVIAEVGDDFYGIQYHANTYDVPLALEKLARIPLRSVRLWAYPSEFHPAPGRWAWEALDARIAEVVAAGYAPVVCLFQAEEWYTGTPDDPWWTDAAARREWAAAARALARRYGDRVAEWIVFDEVNYLHPERDHYMSFGTSAKVYLEAAREIKAVDDDARVGGPSGFAGWENGHWASYVLASEGGAEHLDFVSSNIFLSWDSEDSDATIMDRTIWYEEAPSQIRDMITEHADDLSLVLDAYNASALWTRDGTPDGELWTDPRNVNTFGGVYQTAALLHGAKGGFQTTLRWETLGGFGILSWYPAFEERPPYHAWLLVAGPGRLQPGSHLLDATTSEPPKPDLPHHSGQRVEGYTVQPFAVRRDDGISVVLINKYAEEKRVALSRPQGMAGCDVYRFDADRHETALQVMSSGDEEVLDLHLPGVSVTVVAFREDASTGTISTGPHRTREHRVYNAPNPFSTATHITFDLPSASVVSLDVYSSTGRHVSTLFEGTLSGGSQTVPFEAGDLPSGTYFYRLCINGACTSKPMVLVR